MSNKFKVAFVGAGYMTEEHMRAFNAIPELELVGIHSRTKSKAEKLQKEYGVLEVYDSIEEMYQKTKADLVVVAVSELALNAISKQCFEYQWRVLLEKPAGYSYEDAVDIYNSAKNAQSEVYVALNRRFYSSVSTAKEGLFENLGERFVKIQDQQDLEACRRANVPTKIIDNYMFANSIHQIDLLRVFGRGEIVNVKNIIPWDAQNPGMVVSLIEFDSGDKGLYEGNWSGPGPWSAAINTAEKRWELKPVESVTVQNSGERNKTLIPPHEWDSEFKPGLRKMAEHCLLALENKKHELVNLESSLQSMKLVKDIFGL